MSMTQPGAGFTITTALERHADRVDGLLRQLYTDAGISGPAGGDHRARRLRPPTPEPAFRRRPAREQSVLQWRGTARVAPVVRADNEASGRFTILDIVAGNALGLLYRISRVISQHGCDVDLVLISTEGERAIDVFHITKAGAKLTEAEQRGLTSDLQRTLEGTP